MIDRLLVLGGTSEAGRLVDSLRADGVDAVLSFAGRTEAVSSMSDEGSVGVRVGGFGGADGLARYLVDERIRAVVCATHPFAARMPWNVATACSRTNTAVVRLLRPPWTPVPGDRWLDTDSLGDAASRLVAMCARRVLLTTGRQELRPFASLDSIHFVVRSIDRPDVSGFAHADIVLDRGPFSVESEIALMRERNVDVLVTKNSGGSSTAAKLTAARSLGMQVVMVRRPPTPDMDTVATVAGARNWIAGL